MDYIKIFLRIFVVMFVCNFGIRAQTSDSEYADFLNNHKGSQKIYLHEKTKDIIKVNPILLLDGRLPVSWEHRFNNKFSINVAPGLLLSYDFYDVFNLKNASEDELRFPSLTSLNDKFNNPSLGYSFYIEPRLYKGSWNKLYRALSIGILKYPNLRALDLGVCYGTCIDIGRFHTDLAFRVAYVSQTLLNDETEYKFKSFFSWEGEQSPNVFKISLLIEMGYILTNITK